MSRFNQKLNGTLDVLAQRSVGEKARNKLRTVAVNLKRPHSKRYTDLMEEQKQQWLADPTFEDWDGSQKLLIKQRCQELGCRVPETYLVCESVKELDLSRLPSNYALKPSHLGGGQGVFLVSEGTNLRTGNALDENAVRSVLENCLNRRQEGFHRGAHGAGKPSIIVEELIPSANGDFDTHVDYKVMAIHGRACLIKVCTPIGIVGRETFADYFTRDWQLIDYDEITSGHQPRRYEQTAVPDDLENMVAWSETIARTADKPFIRVDFLRSPSGFVLGECTVRPGSASLGSKLTPFADRQLGRLWQYPELLDSAFDAAVVRGSDLAALCRPGFR